MAARWRAHRGGVRLPGVVRAWTAAAGTRALAYGAVAGVLFALVAVVPALGAFETPALNPFGAETGEGEVTAVAETGRERLPAGGVRRSERVEVRLDGGGTVAIERRVEEGGAAIGIAVAPGDRVLVTESEGPQGAVYRIADRSRTFPLAALAIAFAALVAFAGRRRGLRSLLGLAASFLVIVRFIVPAILAGRDPVAAAAIGAAAIMLATLTIAHGATRQTAAALAGTALSLALTFALAAFAVDFAALAGLAEEHAVTLRILSEGAIDARGLLLAGIIVGALGVLDDVTATQASTVFELRRANPALGAGELFARGLNVGRDHVASTVNTLVLAYAGASLPLLALLAAQPEPLALLASRELIATEIVRTLVGSAGIVAAAPITTGIASLLATSTPSGGAPRRRGRARAR